MSLKEDKLLKFRQSKSEGWKEKIWRYLAVSLIFLWIFNSWPPYSSPLKLDKALALNKVNNWNFNGDATGWSSTNDNGTDNCGSNTSSTADVAMATLAYNGSLGGQTGFEGTTTTGKNIKGRGMVHQTVVAPGTGTVKAKGKYTYYGSSTAWNATPNTSWIRLDLFDSSNANFVAALGCVSFNSNQAWTTTSFSSDASLTGGTTYTVRLTLRGQNLNSASSAAVTLAVDNIVVNFAPVGLSASAVTGSTNASLSWTASTAGTGASGLHGTTPYKVYRDTSSPVSTFLANSTTNSYTDSTTSGNTTYYYAISDVDSANDESPLSAEASVLTNPDVPTSLNFTNVNSTSLRINWTEPAGGAGSYKVESCDGAACSDFSQIAGGVANTYHDDSSLICNTLYRYRVRATNGSGDGNYSSIAEQTTGACGSISVDIVDGSYVSVASPSVSMGTISFGLTCQTTSGTFGTASEQIYVNNNDAADNGWTVSLAASAPTAVWDSAGTDYDFNDPNSSGCADGADADGVGGQMTINPSVGTLAVGQCGTCSTSNVSKGSSNAFSEDATDSITIVSGAAGSDDIGDWVLTGVSISQKIPAQQPNASDYDINLTLTIIAN